MTSALPAPACPGWTVQGTAHRPDFLREVQVRERSCPRPLGASRSRRAAATATASPLQICTSIWGGACPALVAGCPEVPEGWKGGWGFSPRHNYLLTQSLISNQQSPINNQKSPIPNSPIRSSFVFFRITNTKTSEFLKNSEVWKQGARGAGALRPYEGDRAA